MIKKIMNGLIGKIAPPYGRIVLVKRLITKKAKLNMG